MIQRHAPEPRLEPDHRFEDDYDESDDDFLQTCFIEDAEELNLAPYYWEEGEIKALIGSEPR